MATNTWTGTSGDGLWETVGNWSLGTKPATGEDVVVSSQTPITITSGSTQAAVDLESLTIMGPVTIGSASTSLTIAVSNSASSTLRVASTGAFVNIAAGTNGIDKAVIIGTSGGVYRCSGGTYAILEVGEAANVEVEAAATVTTLKQAGGSVYAAAGTGFTTATVCGGMLTSYRNIATGRVSGQATMVTLRNAAAITTGMTVTGGATYEHDSSGTIANLIVESNSKAINPAAPKGFTVTASESWGNATIFENSPVVLTYTAAKTPVAAAVA